MPAVSRFTADSTATDAQRRWRDGSLEEDLPMRSLSETFNVNYFLVSQTNPHIVPLLNLKKRVNRKLGNVVETEWKHRWGLRWSQPPGKAAPLVDTCMTAQLLNSVCTGACAFGGLQAAAEQADCRDRSQRLCAC